MNGATRRLRSAIASLLYALGLPAILVLLWWVTTRGDVSFYTPLPGELVKTSADLWSGPAFRHDLLPSVGLLAVGLVLTVLLGIALGVLIGTFRWLRELLEPLLEFMRAIPPPVLVPLYILIIGISPETKVAVIVTGAIWPVLLNTVEGVRAVDMTLDDTCQVFGIRGLQRLRHLVLPAASPQILTGVRQCLPIGLVMLVVAEMFGGSNGLGYLILTFQHNYAISEMWSGVLVLALVGLALSGMSWLLERSLLRWHAGMRAVERKH